MVSFKKALFGLMMTFALLIGVGVDASLTKNIVGNTQYQNNGVVSYNVSYTNTGSLPVTVRLSDILSTSLMPLPGATASCDGAVSPGSSFVVGLAGQTFSTNFCTLQPGKSAVMNYSVLILSQAFTSIVNNANAETYSGSTFLLNETASASFSSYPVLSIQKTFVGLNPQQINDLVTFKLKVINSGSSVASNIMVSDTIPNGFVYVSSTLPGTPSTNNITNTTSWTIPSLAANSAVEYTVVAKLNTSIPGAGLNVGSSVTNTATIATGSISTPSYVTFGSGGSTSSVRFKIAGIPSVTLKKVLTSPSNGILLASGSSASYTITITNTGTETAIGSITDVLPSELTGFYSNVTPSVVNGATWTWTGITLAPGSTTTITLNGVLGATYPSSRVFTNTATFAYDPNTSIGGLTNNGVATGLIQGLPNLVLQKTLVKSAPSGQSGDTVVYALTVSNSSATTYTGSRCLIDTFPSQITLTSSSISQSNCGTTTPGQISFSGTTLPITIILTGTVNTTLSSGTVITNSGAVSLQTGVELLYTDNTSSAAFTIGGSDLVLNKTVSATTYTGTPGTPVTYTLQYANNGSLPISGVVLTDTLPANLIYSSSSLGGSTLSGSLVSRNLGTLAAGQSGSITLTALISGYIEGGIVNNTATLSSDYQEANVRNNTSSASFTVTPALADVKIVKTIVSQGTYLSGTYYTFRFDVSNIGGLLASGIRISDVLPSMFSYISGSTNLITPSGVSVGLSSTSNTITSDLFNLSAGQSGYVLVTTVLNNNILGTTEYTNTATVSTVTSEASTANNTSSVKGTITAPVISCSGLQYTVTANSPLSNPIGLNTLNGVVVSYTYALTNNLALPIESLTIGTSWPSQVSTPSGLVGGTVASVSNIPVGSGVSTTLAGTTTVDGITNITNPATFTVKVAGGQPFTCNASSVLSVSQSCGNNTINTNLGEQCENYNGTVVVAPGVSFNPATQSCDATCKLKTTKITNCVDMTVGGVVKNACVDTIPQPENPLLTLKKYVNDQDAQDNGTAVSVTNGSTVTYKVVVTNSSSFTAYNVRFSDVVPSGVTYVSNSVSPTTISYTDSTKTLAGNLGNVAPGASVTITFRATVNNSNGYINNIATLNYTDVNNNPKPQLSDPAVITLGSTGGTCNNGIKEGSEQCDIGNLPGTIGNYLDNSTNFPSYPHKGKICTSSCTIQDITLGVCGDGVLGRLEQCDLGGASTINGYLDKSTNYPAGVYNGQQCNSSCNIIGKVQPSIPACWYTDTIISVMKDEYLPFAWDVEVGKDSKLVDSASSCAGNDGAIVKNSLKCTFEIYNRDEEGQNGVSKTIGPIDCNKMMWTDNQYKLFTDFSLSNRDPLFVNNPYGTYYLTPSEVSSMVGSSLGEYKISLEEVKYDYCKNGQAVSGNPYARVCQVNMAVTDNYLMQKGSVSSKTNSDLSNYYELDGDSIYTSTDLNKVDKISSLNYANLSSSMKTLTNGLIAKYEKIAVSTTLDGNTIKKVPGKSIYIMEGGKTFKGADLSTPTTIIIKGNVTIEGDISSNVLLVAQGTVKFNLPTPDRRKDGCNPQIIHGVIVAQGGFVASDNNGYQNDNLSNPRCRKGNLQVYGLLIGNDLQKVVDSRRSHLEHWFTFRQDGANITVDDPEVKAERRKEIYEGASVYIEQNPSLWRDMPPGADEFLKTLNVSRS